MRVYFDLDVKISPGDPRFRYRHEKDTIIRFNINIVFQKSPPEKPNDLDLESTFQTGCIFPWSQ